MKIEGKSFAFGIVLVGALSLLYIFQDSIFIRKIRIEVLNPETNQVTSFDGNGNILITIAPPQRTTDWKDEFDVHSFRAIVNNGSFFAPARFYDRIVNGWCIEEGCSTIGEMAAFSVALKKDAICTQGARPELKTEPDSILVVCNREYYH